MADALRSAGFTNLPEPAEMARAMRDGRLPWIDRQDGRWGFDLADLPKIANALGMKAHEPKPNAASSPLDALSSKFSELMNQDRKHA
jgi:hypothetical protein